MDTFKSTAGEVVAIGSSDEQLRIEHILQTNRDVWKVVPTRPYLAIDIDLVRSLMPTLQSWIVFSGGQLLQNMRPQDIASRVLGLLGGGGTIADMGKRSEVLVRGKANSKARHLMNFNPPFIVGSTPWVAAGTHFIAVEGDAYFQHEFAELVTVNNLSRPKSNHFDFTALCDLRDKYNSEYLDNPSASTTELDELNVLLDRTFDENKRAIAAADAYHKAVSVNMVSFDYDAPILTKYDRLTHDASGKPQIEVAYALLHYERAIKDYNNLIVCRSAAQLDDALSHGINCVVSAAACVEAIANRLVFEATGLHPTYRDRRQPLEKINDAATKLAATEGKVFNSLVQGTPVFDSLEEMRILRNGFMHAKELETDIDPTTSTSDTLNKVDQANCERFLVSVRECASHVFSQLTHVASPIVTKKNITWMGDLVVP